MLRLEEIASETILTGLDPDGGADLRVVRWIGGKAVESGRRTIGALRG